VWPDHDRLGCGLGDLVCAGGVRPAGLVGAGDVGEALADGEVLAVADALAEAELLGDDDVARCDGDEKADGEMSGRGTGTAPIGPLLRWSFLTAWP
jgi:hypothetical protein